MSDDVDFDVEAEIARELAALGEATASLSSWSVSSITASNRASNSDTNDEDEPASLAALKAAMQEQNKLADRLAATLQDVQQLPLLQQHESHTMHYEVAASDDVAAAVAAFMQLTATSSSSSLQALDAVHSEAADTATTTALASNCLDAVSVSTGAEEKAEAAEKIPSQGTLTAERAVDRGRLQTEQRHRPNQPSTEALQKLWVDAVAQCVDAAVEGHVSNAAASNAVLFEEHIGSQAASSPVAAPANPHMSLQLGQVEEIRPTLSTSIAAAAADAAAASVRSPTKAAATLSTVAAPDGSETAAATNHSAAAVADAQLAAERVAAAAAHEQLLAEQVALQLVLEQQAAAAAARAAAQAERLEQLRQQAETAARRYMASCRIARVWKTYYCSAAHTRKLQAVARIQAAVRGVAARKLAEQLRLQKRLLAQLKAALEQGGVDAVQEATDKAKQAGVGAAADQLIASYHTTVATAAQQLQQAADDGNYAAFTAAAEVAQRYPSLQDLRVSCTAKMDARRSVAEQALSAAVAGLPLAQVQGAVDVALQLGTPAKQLAAALEAARARDAAVVVQLTAAVKAAAAAVQQALKLAAAGVCGSSATVIVGVPQNTSQNSSCDGAGSDSTAACTSAGFNLQDFDALAAKCQRLSIICCDVTSARRQIAQHRQTLAAQLAIAADSSPSAAVIEQLMQSCVAFGGLEREVQAAANKLQQRRAQLAMQLQQQLGLNSDATSAAVENGKRSAVCLGIKYSDAQALMQQAQQLGVSDVLTADAQQQLDAMQQAAMLQLQQAADTASLVQFKEAVMKAREFCVVEQLLQQCKQQMQQRRTEAAEQLVAAATECCRAAATCGLTRGSHVLMSVVNAIVQAIQACRSSSSSNQQEDAQLPGLEGCFSTEQYTSVVRQSHLHQQLQEGRGADKGLLAALQQLWQHVQHCLELGLASNAVLALQAVETACNAALHESHKVVAACSMNLDGNSCVASQPGSRYNSSAGFATVLAAEESWGVDEQLPDSTDAEAGLSSQQNIQQELSSTPSQAEMDVELPEPQQQQLPGLAWATGPAGMCAAEHLLACSKPHMMRPHAVLQLQRQWAQNMKAVTAAETQAGLPGPGAVMSCNCAKGGGSRSNATSVDDAAEIAAIVQTGRCAPDSGTPGGLTQHQQHKGLIKLQQLLTANAAVPVGQLSSLKQLDLSLEQLHELQGLDQLCPQLTSLAVNMNKLSSLVGLQSCQQLRELCAKDNALLGLPDIQHNPHLSSLQLDNNTVKQIMRPCSNSSSGTFDGYRQPHYLQLLSLNSNRLTTLLLSEASSPTSSSNSTASSSISSSSSSRRLWLSSWLVSLQVLRLQGNQLQSLDGLQGCSSLRQLDVSRNRLTCLQGLMGCHVLQQLIAADNLLCSLPAALHLPILQMLDLSNNRFTSWPSLPPMPHLCHLSFSDNQLTALQPLDGFLQLRDLNLGFNQLSDLQHTLACLSGMPALQQLHLHDNPCCTCSGVDRDMEVGQQIALLQLGPVVDDEGGTSSIALRCYRQQVAAALPWLQLLDRQELQLDRSGATRGSAGAATAADIAQYIGHHVSLATELMRQLRAGSLRIGLPLQQPQQQQQPATAGAGGCSDARSSAAGNSMLSSSQLAGTTVSVVDMQATVAHWLPCLLNSVASAASADVSFVVDSSSSFAGEELHGRQMSSTTSSTPKQQLEWQLPCKHLEVAECSSNVGGYEAEQRWCYNTRAMLVWQQAAQQQQAAAVGRPQSLGLTDTCDSSKSAAAAAAFADPSDLVCMLHQHLNELSCQPCTQSQEQLVHGVSYAQQQQSVLQYAAELLQCSWRARAVRLQYRQQLQQFTAEQVTAAAAVALQSMWRGYCARLLLTELQQQRQLEQQQGVYARNAAAARIQAAVRGFRVRQRLKAALAAASSASSMHSSSRPLPAAAAAAAAIAAKTAASGDSWDDDEFTGVPDDFVSMPAALLQELAQEEVQSSSSSSSGPLALWPGSSYAPAAADVTSDVQRAPHLKVLADASSSSFSAAANTLLPPIQQPSAATAAVQQCTGSAVLQEAVTDEPADATSRYEAKLQKLMQEWGFTDRATAEAYYRRQKHTKKAAIKHKLQQQLKNPTVRLQRLQEQLGTAPAAAALARSSSVVSSSSKVGSTKAIRGPVPSQGLKHQSLEGRQQQRAALPARGGNGAGSASSSNCSAGSSSRGSESGSSEGAAGGSSHWAVPAVMPGANRTNEHDEADDRMSVHSFSSCGSAARSVPSAGMLAKQSSCNGSGGHRQMRSSLSIKQAALPAVVGGSPSTVRGAYSEGKSHFSSTVAQQLPTLPRVRGAT